MRSPHPADPPAAARGGRRGTISTLLAGAIALPFVTSVLAAALALAQQHRQDENTASLTRAFEVRRASQAVLTQLLDLESSQRGFVLTGKADYVATYDAARREMPDALRELTALVDANPDQSARAADLARLAGARMAFSAEVTAAMQAGDEAGARALVESGRGKALTDEARQVVTAMDGDEEARLLAGHAALRDASAAQARNLGALVLASTVALAVLVLVVRRMLTYQGVVRMCTWSRTVEYQGEWLSFEEYLARRFGVETTPGISPAAARQVRDEALQTGSRATP